MMDLDDLKHINDTYGHDWGDHYIQNTGRCIAEHSPPGTVCARLSGDELILVACEAPQRGFHMTSETGTRLPVHASSQGKAILSAMPVYEAEALLRRRPLQVCTPHTVTAPEQLLAQLPAIRRGGYAEEHEEYRLGLKSVAAPIYEGDGPCRYAIGVICIAGTPAAEFASMRAAVMETAQNLSALLGHRAPGGI